MSLRQSDAIGALNFLREAEDVTGPEPFPPRLLERLQTLIPANQCEFCELDRVRCIVISSIDSSGEPFEDDPADEEQQIYWRLRHEHPVCGYRDRTGDFSARKISDFKSQREYHRLELYADCYRHLGVEYALSAGLPAPHWHTKMFILVRGRHDFDERDRAVLELLRPHLAYLYKAAKTRALADALATGASVPGELVVLDRADRIVYATGSARRLLAEYTRETPGARLPETVEAWLRHDRRRLNGDSLPAAAGPLSIEGDRRRLVISRLNRDRALVLAEEPLAPSPSELLTPRELQILALVAQGETNVEIARDLWISATTVRGHLESVYRKLGVHNRTAAAARLRASARMKPQA